MKDLKAKDFDCKNCGGNLIYSPENKKLYCEKCGSLESFEIEQVEAKHNWSAKEEVFNTDWNNEQKNLICNNCGANIQLNGLEYSSVCPYCGTGLVSTLAVDKVAPDGIIPFTFSDKVASEKYVKGIKKKWFLPDAFKKAPPTENIKGIYIPSFGYDFDTDSKYNGVLEKDYTHRDSDGKIYTTTSKIPIAGTYKSLQENIMVETSSKLTQSQFAEINGYDMDSVVKFNNAFIMGYSVEKYENTIEECNQIAQSIMKSRIKNEILSKYNYDRVVRFNLDVNILDQKFRYYLLPVYKCDYTYKNKNYTTFMNGQTGRVGGGYPKSPVKITFTVIFFILLVAALIGLFMFI